MAHKRGPMLLAALILVSVWYVQGSHDGSKVSYSDLLTVFGDIAGPYEEKKTARNQQTDLQVNNIIEQIQDIVPGLTALHNLLHNISANVPLLKVNIGLPLLQAKSTLKKAAFKLSRCEQPGRPLVDQSPVSASQSEDSSSEEESDLAEVHESSEQYDVESPTLNDVITSVGIGATGFDAILQPFADDSVVSLRDAAEAFKTVADRIARAHGIRFLSLVPKIKKVKDNIATIIDHVTKTKWKLYISARALAVSTHLPSSVSKNSAA